MRACVYYSPTVIWTSAFSPFFVGKRNLLCWSIPTAYSHECSPRLAKRNHVLFMQTLLQGLCKPRAKLWGPCAMHANPQSVELCNVRIPPTMVSTRLVSSNKAVSRHLSYCFTSLHTESKLGKQDVCPHSPLTHLVRTTAHLTYSVRRDWVHRCTFEGIYRLPTPPPSLNHHTNIQSPLPSPLRLSAPAAWPLL